jgi:hypothetical protein
MQKLAGVSQSKVMWFIMDILQWGKDCPGIVPCQNSEYHLSSFQTSYKEFEFLESLNCSFCTVLYYSMLSYVVQQPLPWCHLHTCQQKEMM